MSPPVVQLVSATRLEEAAFWCSTLLGRSLRQPQHRELVARICFTNRDPLAIPYNAAINAAPAGAVLVFCHDDVDLGPEPLAPQLEVALTRFDLVGVAGNQRHQRGQVGWWLDPRSGGWDHPFLSGALRHGTPERSQLDVYGPAPMPVQLLDGVFLAARADSLQRSGVRFDPQFAFHYYDLDVCRSARRAGLSLGTWPLPLLHASGGEPWGVAWTERQRAYLRKWGEGSELGEASSSAAGSSSFSVSAVSQASGSAQRLSQPTLCAPSCPPPPEQQLLFRLARAQEKAQAWPEAERLYRQLLERAPAHGPARLQLAKVLHRQGRDRESLALLDALLDGPWVGAGRLASAGAQPAGAPPMAGGERASGSSAEAAAPLRAKAHTNRGAILQQQGDLDAAQRDYGEALRRDPNLKTAADNLFNLALQLRSQGNPHQALEALRMILRATPQRPDLLLQLGSTLMELGRVEAAVPCFRRLLRLEPRQREGRYQLGQALAALGDTEAGIAALNAALDLDPTAIDVLAQLETQRLSLCDWDDYDNRIDRLLAQLRAHAEAPGAAVDGRLVPPLSLNLFPVPLALQRRLGERWAEPTSRDTKALRLPPPPPRQPDGRWRIGYLSADFRQHAMGTLIHGLFAHHDRSRFEVYAYSLASYHDAITEAIRGGVDHYSEVAQESAAAIAQRIRADRLDVLIDLMGHTHHSRPAVLAMRPVPLQLHYLGYPGSLGADWIDGVIADPWLIPPEHEPHYREAVHRLPWGFVSSGPVPDQQAPIQSLDAVAVVPPMPAAAPGPRPPSREALGLPVQAVVFACFNRPEKITPVVFDDWLEILRQVPDAVLWLINDQPRLQANLRARVEAAGLERQRLVFSPMVETAAFGAICSLADLLLDTSPYGSGATAVTALAAGLPLLTWPGETFASRMGASLCAATGLEELICPSPSAYRERAIALGRQPSELRRLRRHLLERHHELPLFNTAAWVGHLESLLEGLLEGKQNQGSGGEQHTDGTPGPAHAVE